MLILAHCLNVHITDVVVYIPTVICWIGSY